MTEQLHSPLSPEEKLGSALISINYLISQYSTKIERGFSMEDIEVMLWTLRSIRKTARLLQSALFTTDYYYNDGDLALLGKALEYCKAIETEAVHLERTIHVDNYFFEEQDAVFVITLQNSYLSLLEEISRITLSSRR